MHVQIIENDAAIFSWFWTEFFQTALPRSDGLSTGERLDAVAVWINCEQDVNTEYKAYLPGIWAQG